MATLPTRCAAVDKSSVILASLARMHVEAEASVWDDSERIIRHCMHRWACVPRRLFGRPRQHFFPWLLAHTDRRVGDTNFQTDMNELDAIIKVCSLCLERTRTTSCQARPFSVWHVPAQLTVIALDAVTRCEEERVGGIVLRRAQRARPEECACVT